MTHRCATCRDDDPLQLQDAAMMRDRLIGRRGPIEILHSDETIDFTEHPLQKLSLRDTRTDQNVGYKS